MKKKSVLLLSLAVILAVTMSAGTFAQEGFKVVVNGTPVFSGTALGIENGRILAPADGLADKFGATVTIDQQSGKLTIDGKYASIDFTIDQTKAYIHRKYDFSAEPEQATLDAAPRLVNDILLVPLRFVCETLGGIVTWDEETQAASIDTKTLREPVLSYEVVAPEEIEGNDELLAWYEQNFKTEGIHFKVFDNEIYILASAGEKPTGGYSIKIESFTMVSPNKAYIVAKVTSPAPGAIVTDALTYPNVFIKTPAQSITEISGDIIVSKISDDKSFVIDENDVTSIMLRDLYGEKLKDYNRDEIKEIVGYYNASQAADDPYIMMLAGNSMLITMTSGDTILLTSYGSKENIVANFTTKAGGKNYHLICPEIAKMLLDIK